MFFCFDHFHFVPFCFFLCTSFSFYSFKAFSFICTNKLNHTIWNVIRNFWCLFGTQQTLNCSYRNQLLLLSEMLWRKVTAKQLYVNKRGGKPRGADAYRYLTGEAEVGGGAALLAGGGAHAAVGAAGWVLPFPPLRGCLSGRLSFGATSKEKQRPCQEHNAYRQRQGVGVCTVCTICKWDHANFFPVLIHWKHMQTEDTIPQTCYTDKSLY